jgi:uncharacterized RDD family membrane protein YckC
MKQYYVGKNGQQLGPFGEEQIKARVAAGEFTTTDLMWCEGMAAWEPIGTVFNNPYMPSAVLGASPLLQARENQQPLAGAGARLVSVILNGLLGALVALPGVILTMVGLPTSSATPSATPDISTLSIIGIALIFLSVLGLWIYQLMLYLKTGQTLGKKWMGVRVVRFTDGGNPGFGGLIGLREILIAVIGMVPLVGFIFSIVDMCFIFRDDRRCIHDLIANTKVVVA